VGETRVDLLHLLEDLRERGIVLKDGADGTTWTTA
jgi:hypothetical protein